MSQPVEALKIANDVRIEGARQRKALVGKPMHVVVDALRHPTPELGRQRLRLLFFPKCTQQGSVIPLVGRRSLQRAFNRLSIGSGRRSWHADLRLGELTQRERNNLIDDLVRQAPSAWREAA